MGSPRNQLWVTLSYSLSLPKVCSFRLSQSLLLIKLRSEKGKAILESHTSRSHFWKDKKGTFGEEGCVFMGVAPPSWRNCWSQEGAGVNTPPAQGIAGDGSPQIWIQNWANFRIFLLTLLAHLFNLLIGIQTSIWKSLSMLSYPSQSNLWSICNKTDGCVKTNFRFGEFWPNPDPCLPALYLSR